MKREIFTAEWACFGAYVAGMMEKGVIFPDLSPSNVGILSDRIVIHDMDCGELYAFPGDLNVYATALFSLLGYIPIHFVASFRFGYIHHAGRLGRLVFDSLRHEFSLTPWGDPSQIPIIPKLGDIGWVTEHQDWMRRRDSVDLLDLDEGAWIFPSLLRPNASIAVGQEIRSRDVELAFHAFERQLIVSLARNDFKDFIWAITEIGLLAAERSDKLRSQVWGMTITLLTQPPPTARGPAWPEFSFWLPWTAEEEVRSLQGTS